VNKAMLISSVIC